MYDGMNHTLISESSKSIFWKLTWAGPRCKAWRCNSNLPSYRTSSRPCMAHVFFIQLLFCTAAGTGSILQSSCMY